MKTDIEASSTSKNKNKSPKKKDQKSLKFDNIKELTYFRFLKEALSFSASYLVHKLITMIIFIMYSVSSNETLSGQISLVVLTLDLLSSGIRDFQKPISIICGPAYSKFDFFVYRVKRNQLIFINTFLYFCFLIVLTFLKSIYRAIGVAEENIDGIMFQSYLYIFIYKPLITTSNFLQGD